MIPIEEKAAAIIKKCTTIELTSITEDGYPRIFFMNIAASQGAERIFFTTGTKTHKVAQFKKDPKSGIACSNGHDVITMTGTIKIVEDQAVRKSLWKDFYKGFFPGGPEDSGYCVLQFDALEAAFWIDEEYTKCRYTAKGIEVLQHFCQGCGIPRP
ncbi:MAG: pyridoxamine 5'-phosphate oxidase family protein [Cloacibacillus sp.]